MAGQRGPVGLEYGLDIMGVNALRRLGPVDPDLGLTAAVTPLGAYQFGAVWRIPSRPGVVLSGRVSTLERNRFYGFGNQTSAALPTQYYRLEQFVAEVRATVTGTFGGRHLWAVGPFFRLTNSEAENDAGVGDDDVDVADDGGVLAVLRPYGSGAFRQAGVRGHLRFRSARESELPVAWLASLTVDGMPGTLDLETATLSIRSELLAGARLLPATHLTLRVAAHRVEGSVPFHRAAFLGGRRSLRGFQKQRYAGDLALSGTAQLRLPGATLGVRQRTFGIGPILAFDIGRTWYRGVSPGGWHAGGGGGLWLRDVESGRSLTAVLATGDVGARVYFGLGFLLPDT